MDVGIVSMRYARAFIEYAQSLGKEDELYENMKSLAESFLSHTDLREALNNPVLTDEEKTTLISVAAGCADGAGRELKNCIALILHNRRENMLQYIANSYMTLYRKSKNIKVAKLTTAVPVNAEVEKRIRNSASTALHAEMELLTKVDPSIKGGFIFDINDYRLDASIATQLKRVKQQFIDKNRRIV